MVLKSSTEAEIEVKAPSEEYGTRSSPPLSGLFWVQCFNTDGNDYATNEMPVDISASDL